ncbi:MAG: quinone-dependent dihydroorotate dehydrogenase [Pseudomonadota bacterium]
MAWFEQAGLRALRQIDPERAHSLALYAVKLGLSVRPGPVTSPRLKTVVAGIDMANPVGLAAGFDKNATAVNGLSRAGFGFLEVGAATPRPQEGNGPPRLFRLPEDAAAINRFGFNNQGVAAIAARLAQARPAVPVGLNLGANKDSADRVSDFAHVLKESGAHLDFATINVSSPNTEKLRDLQGPDALRALIETVLAARYAMHRRIPIFVKIAPDLDDAGLALIARVALESDIDGLIATNTTLARDGLKSAAAGEAGGLSGKPLMARSTQVLARLAGETDGKLPLIGVGGVASGQDAFDKICAGASAVQLYTALAYQGLSLAARIAEDLDKILEKNGFARVAEAVGSARERFAGP